MTKTLKTKLEDRQDLINLVNQIKNTPESERSPLYSQLSRRSMEYKTNHKEYFRMPETGGCAGE